MITVKTNISVVSGGLLSKLQSLRDPKPLLRTVALSVLPIITERIHEHGKAADDSQIGTYSKSYLKMRSGAFKNNVATKGKNKGNTRKGTAGVKSKGPNAGASRPSYNRSSDPKIIVSLTRQLENDWAVLATPKGWGIGFNNPLNAQKMKWVEEQKNKTIAKLTPSEKEYAVNKVKELVSAQLK